MGKNYKTIGEEIGIFKDFEEEESEKFMSVSFRRMRPTTTRGIRQIYEKEAKPESRRAKLKNRIS